jgi:hypothetical protein
MKKATVAEQQTTTLPPVKKVKQAVMTAEVIIRGLKPLLMSSPKEMFLTGDEPFAPSKIGKKIDPKAEAEKRAYRDKDKGWRGDLCIPAGCIKTNMVEAVKLFEAQNEKGKKMRGGIKLTQKIRGSIRIEPDFIPIFNSAGEQVTDYEVNAAKVRVKATGGSVIRYRPEIPDWELRFKVKWNPYLYGVHESVIQDLLEQGGYLGLLDFRPEYGLYELTKFEVVE